jgi:hypothetical protein
MPEILGKPCIVRHFAYIFVSHGNVSALFKRTSVFKLNYNVPFYQNIIELLFSHFYIYQKSYYIVFEFSYQSQKT